jgi:type II restriction/modification system DNA methylase subunit YeeA
MLILFSSIELLKDEYQRNREWSRQSVGLTQDLLKRIKVYENSVWGFIFLISM